MDREKVIKWLEYDYLPRVGAYRRDCKQGCDVCMPMHDGEDYCDIDMLCKILALLKEDCHNCKLECLLQKYDELKEKHDTMLKEKEATIEILVKDITFHNCNNCNRKDCVIKPNAGQPVRSNCIFWLESR